jgi:hypothetical protein
MSDASIRAWNNFVFHSKPDAYEKGSTKWAAATARFFMGLACNGGFFYFLDCSPEKDAQEVKNALDIIGADAAAAQLGFILAQLGRSLPPSTAKQREKILRECWSEPLNEIDTLQGGPYEGLMAALEAHVAAEENFYLNLAVEA